MRVSKLWHFFGWNIPFVLSHGLACMFNFMSGISYHCFQKYIFFNYIYIYIMYILSTTHFSSTFRTYYIQHILLHHKYNFSLSFVFVKVWNDSLSAAPTSFGAPLTFMWRYHRRTKCNIMLSGKCQTLRNYSEVCIYNARQILVIQTQHGDLHEGQKTAF